MDALPDSLKLDFLPRLTGSLSTPARQNPTVAMIEAAYQHHKLHARYINCEVSAAELADAVRGVQALGWIGFNCSIPHKQAIIPLLSGLGRSASLIGAVNCVVIRDDKLIGENTDGIGFLKSLRHLTDPAGKRFVLLGAGGAARAIAVELALAGASHLTLVNRNRARAEEVAKLVADNTKTTAEGLGWDKAFALPADTDILVNATSIGFYPDTSAMPNVVLESLRPGMIVADVIPNPPHTALLQAASERGCVTLDGLGMLVYQGVASIEHWMGEAVDASVMRSKLEDIFRISRAS
ncbi:MAG: shikimate dehydrogenase [Edaphobacter sp.]|uniref:shikimate dehydrogenase n=1 Tax=Edaphobacter sp. TaxID=1934404 RepID=UPI002396A77A|nr:shikimate dehydrogenase [Edaphobacter sp.]MDE1176392.1 shikimate dehydrogenase [Edaphobacter sp.]